MVIDAHLILDDLGDLVPLRFLRLQSFRSLREQDQSPPLRVVRFRLNLHECRLQVQNTLQRYLV